MRIRTLTLERYGGWSDRDLALGAGLTIVSGPNEAGKTTLLDALSDLLWGIPRPVQHAWAFSPSRLALGARVTLDGRDVGIRRTTRGLSDGDGAPLEAPWGPGGAEARKRWRQGFGLGHEELRAGGRRLCDGGGDLAELVFTARSGRDVRAVVGALDSEADKLFRDHRGSKSVEVRAAMGRYERTEEQAGEQMARAGEVTALVDEIGRLERRATDLARSRAVAARDTDHARQSVRGRSPARTVAELRVDRAALEASGAVLDATRLDEYRAASDALATAEQDVAEHRGRADDLRARRGELDVDETLLADAARVRELQDAAQARDADAGRATALRAESADLHRRAETALLALFAPEPDPEPVVRDDVQRAEPGAAACEAAHRSEHGACGAAHRAEHGACGAVHRAQRALLAAVHLPADRSRDLDELADALRAAEDDRERAERAHRAALGEVRDAVDGVGGLDLDRVAQVAEVRRAIEAEGSAAAQWRSAITDRADARARRDDALAAAGWLPPVRPAPAPRRPRCPAPDEWTLWPAGDDPAEGGRRAARNAVTDRAPSSAADDSEAPEHDRRVRGNPATGGRISTEVADHGGTAEAEHPRIAPPPAREMRRLRSALRDAVHEASAAARAARAARDRAHAAESARDAVAGNGRPVGPATLTAARADRDARISDLLDTLRRDASGAVPMARTDTPGLAATDGSATDGSVAGRSAAAADSADIECPGTADPATAGPVAAGPTTPAAPSPATGSLAESAVAARVPGPGDLAAAAARAERAIGAADRIADDMIDSADRVAELAHRDAELTAARDEVTTAGAAAAAAERARRDADAAWAALWRAHGVVTPDPDDADAVCASLADAARAHAEVVRADERLAGLYDQTRAQEEALATALTRAGRPREGAGLDTLLVAATDLATEADRVRDRRVLLGRLRTDADRAGGAADAARHEGETAALRWRHALRAAGLPADLEPAGWATRRDTVGEAQQAGRGAARADAEADRLDRTVTTHRDAVAALVAAHLPEAPADPQTRLPDLAERVRIASEAAVSSAHLDDAVADAEREAARALRTAQTARSVLDRLAVELALTETLDDGGLEAAAERGARAVELGARLDEAGRLLAAAAPDLDAERLVADAPDTEAGALDEHRARCEETERELETAHADVIEQLGGLRARRRELEGADAAATLHAEAQEHLARAADAAERYLVVHLQREILRRELDTYERTHASPLLVDAGRLLERLTGGRFVALRPPAEGGRRLVAVRADGEEMDPSRLSEGTADQVHLALRLAGIEQLQSDRVSAGLPTVPVVLDDVLMTFDDERAIAATAVLADLARRFQVLLFTHHDHLVTLARRAGQDFALAELASPSAVDDPVDADAARGVPVG